MTVTPMTAALIAQPALAALAVVAALTAPAPHRNRAAGGLIAALGVAGAVAGALALAGHRGELRLDLALGGLDLTLMATPLGGLFTLLAGAVGAIAAVYGIGYAHGPTASRTAWTGLAVFLLGLQLVPAAGDVLALLLAWELMAAGSSVLVLAEHRSRSSVRPAGLWYAVMTHLSFILVAAGLALLAGRAESTSFSEIGDAHLTGTSTTVAFLLLTVGFATKAGVVPLHVWLPRAHPEAPSHVSALMSAVMVKMGIYGIILTTSTLLPDGPTWWGLVLLALALPSALYGILQAAVASDLKRLLAYSTTENIGLILAALGVAHLTRTPGTTGVAGTALLAALLLTISHAAFKTALFLVAGSILSATGERDLDRLGGLARRMPVTSLTLGIGALGAAALPVASGFAAEWTLLQALIHADARTDRLTTALLPAVIGVVALTAGLALLTFTKAFGIAALARPRSHGAEEAVEVNRPMRVAMLVAAAAVLVLGLLPGPVAAALTPITGSMVSGHSGWTGLTLPHVGATLDVGALLTLGLVLTGPIVLLSLRLARAVPRRRVDLGWGCGGVRTSPRMQYTATSYAEPLVRIFDDALSPTTDVTVTRSHEFHNTVRAMSYSQQVVDAVEARAYAPALRLVAAAGDQARRIQNGSIHRYLAFSFVALVLVLVGVLR